MTFLPIDRVTPLAVRADKVRGVHLAIVVENKDGNGNPGYRVKVKYPNLSDEEKTYWARIAIPMAGPDRGTYFLPELDDQVLVVFEHGDIERPIVIGALWSKKQEPVENNDSGKNNTKLIKSKTGHRVIFDDKEGAEKITIVDSTKKNKIVLDTANKIVKIESAGDIEVKAAANVIMHSNALKVGIKANMKGSGQQVLMHGTSTFGLKAGGVITLKAGQITANVSNGAACQVSGSGGGSISGIAAEQAQEQTQPQSSQAPAAAG
ncbi:MAG TPA: phage baseplate assembly protein V, partial [Kofleriaceae bacterium]|nr:phage baseplate assembly protein V [Kofleriaceae bacterium]